VRQIPYGRNLSFLDWDDGINIRKKNRIELIRLVEAVMLQTCIQEVPGLNSSQDCRSGCGFHKSLPAKSVLML
jgi:hypothetical protein